MLIGGTNCRAGGAYTALLVVAALSYSFIGCLAASILFGGGVTFNAGGLLIAGSSTGTRDAFGVVSAFTNGPLGTGVLTVAANGAFLQADATARTLNNDFAFGAGVSNLAFRGTGSLTLNERPA